ncbi:MAG: isoprenylcysteine carboxylmethyltransferase family protein, partial [Proteobacteria bacterium]|nr:isoprenylcysteine carboxylmethyltransferase family protein [Pseudomonadota bacterium]
MSLLAAQIIYALAWFSFGLGHSLLAGTRAKDLLAPALGPYYRIAYNALAGIHIAAVWLAGK